MSYDPSWYEVSNGVSGLLFVILGVLVARVRSGGAPNRAFALFAIAFGSAMMVLNLGLGGAPKNPANNVEAVGMAATTGLLVVSASGLVWLWNALPRPHDGARMAGTAFVVAVILYALVAKVGAAALGRSPTPWTWMFLLAYQSQIGAMWVLSAACAIRLPRASIEQASGYATTGAALTLYPAFWGGIQYISGSARAADGMQLWAALWLVLPAVVVAAIWLLAAMRAPRPQRTFGFAVAWICLTAILLGMIAVPADATGLHTHWGYGVSRMLAVGLLALAIVRHQVLGLDLKLRWTISKSTVAGALIAAIFLASEGAQLVFGEERQWLGLVAGGALVFAISPLQRAADRLAAAAVPGVQRAAPTSVATDAYKAAVRAALCDGAMTRREERHLAEVASALGIDPLRALQWREEVERAEQAPR